MILDEIHLRNFRNFPQFSHHFKNQKISKIYGQNGSGKTNLLEAIFIIFTTKSFRNRKTLRDCISFGQEFFHLHALIDDAQYGITYQQEGNEKSYYIRHERVKASDFFQGKSIIYFSPEETTAFFHSQDVRRSLMDRYLSALKMDYFQDLIQYNQMKSRKVQILNSQTKKKEDLLKLEREIFLRVSGDISNRREWFIQNMNNIFQRYVENFNKKLVGTSIRYRRKGIPDDFLAREIFQQRVLYGSHKDDLEITENGREFRNFYSNGEKKVINLAIHFAFMEMLRLETNTNCLACLDDLESELDHRVLDNILETIHNSHSQFIITSKQIDNYKPSDLLLPN